ncbi:autotransporter-associated N-terminal domain-containing protein [Fusobacterium necrophorum subsp. necrophorum]|nr:autotransporter-associated N-terminal domain-containing protein [Fusobacterium necrophorum]AZW08344.1 autotransporter-associated N-terminal domain-containing protein [Fusobacterium necrophorum subsp. necrophorum]
MIYFDQVQRQLKACLKHSKHYSFSISLLVAFLISGTFAFASTPSPKDKPFFKSRKQIHTEILNHKIHIDTFLLKNLNFIQNADLKAKLLLQRADFWMKPLHDSFQFFFLYDWRNYNKNRNRNTHNFKGNEFVQDNTFAKEYGQVYKGINYGAYGIIKNPFEFVDSVDFGANISPKTVAEKNISEKTVSQKTITPPTIVSTTVAINAINAPQISTPTIADMTEPTEPQVIVNQPGTIPTLSSITVAPITALNISPTPPTVGEAPSINVPTVQRPATPAGFTPRLVSPPVVEEKKVNDPRVPDPPALSVTFQDVPANLTGYNKNAALTNNGLISQLDLLTGTYDMYFRGHGQGQEFSFSGATANPFTPSSGGLALPNSDSGNFSKVAFYGIGGKASATISENVTMNMIGNYQSGAFNTIFYIGNNLSAGTQTSLLTNKGKVNIYGNKLLVVNSDNVSSASGSVMKFVNEGTITSYTESKEFATGKTSGPGENIIFAGFTYGNNASEHIENGVGGKVIFYTPGSAGWMYSPAATATVKRSAINNGEMKLYGKNSLGIGTNEKTRIDDMAYADIQLNTPIEILGDQSVGASIKIQPSIGSNNFINSTWNIKVGGLDKAQQSSFGDEIYDSTTSTSKAGNILKVEQSIGLNFDFDPVKSGTLREIEIKKYKVSLEADADSSTGIRVGNAKINLTETDNFSQIKINGTNNIGLLSDGATAELKYSNTKNALNLHGGEGNILFATINSGKLNVENNFILETSDGSDETSGAKFVSAYTKGVNSKVTFAKGISFKHTGDETIGMYAADSGNITVTNPTSVTLPTITSTSEVDNSTLPNMASTVSTKLSVTGNKSVSYYANAGGIIENTGSITKVTNGSALAYAKGANSKITISNSLLDYSGEGYSLYTENSGKIVADNSVLVLRGKAVGMKVNSVTSSDISFTNGKIVMMSNDAIPFVASDITGTVNASNIIGGLGLPNITIAKGKDVGTVFNKYKIAAIDGMVNLIIDQDLDKKYATDDSNETSSDLSKKASYALFRRYLIQRAKVEASGKTIKAVLDSNDLTKLDATQVVGLEMSSSKNANNVNETAINLVNSKIIADRNGEGTGAVGAYINYGLVNIDATSKIEVEKDISGGNSANNRAVGVYAVNGSKVDNKGTIEAGGKESVGILAMAYGESGGNIQQNQFGGKTGEGTFSVTNSGNITISDDDAIGIYAKNNNTSIASNDYKVTNTGTIEVKKSVSKTAIGIYADKSTILPKDGTIKIGEKAVGIYLKGASKLLGDNVTLKQTATGRLGGKVGILADTLTNKILNTKVVADTGVNDVIAYYSKGNGALTVEADISLNENSTGITGEDAEDLVYSGNKTIKLGKKSTGIYGQKNITFASGSKIELNGNNSVGVFAKGSSGAINSEGKIKFTKENSLGLYGADGATVNDKTTSMDFSDANAKNNIGVYLAGSKWIDEKTSTYTFDSDHSKNNIYLFVQGGTVGGTDTGSTATLKSEFKVAPTGTASSTEKTIGMYFDTAVKGKSTSVDNTLDMTNASAKISVTNAGIGVYAKNADTSKNNIIKKINVSSDGQGSVGVFTDGNLKLNGTNGLIEAKSNGIGLYGNKGKVTVEGNHKVEITSAGTGAYLTNGSYLSEGKLELKNNTAGTAAAGVYYTKGNATSEVEHKTELHVKDGDNLLALYADGGIKLKNSAKINVSKGTSNVGAFVTGSSELNNNANITLSGNGFKQGLGIYVANGKATNSTDKTIKVEDKEQNSLSVAMAADKIATGTSAIIVNAGNIEAIGDAIGMSVAEGAEGINVGTITATNDGSLKAIGVYVNGANATFNGTGGTISSENIALALKDTGASKITKTGSLKLTKTGAVGVYANNSVVDFEIAPTVALGVDKTVALYATGTTKIKSQITSAAGKSHIGIYAEGDAEFQTGSKVIVSNGSGSNYGIGIYTKAGYNKDVNTDIQQNGKETIGLFLGSNGGAGSTVKHTGTIDVGGGIGTFIPKYSKFVAQNTTFNIGTNGTAVFLKGGTADLGSTGTANINFTGSGRAIYQDGGTLTTGAGLHITGTGSFLTLKNADSTINSIVEVGTNGIGIHSIYDSSAQNYTLKLASPTGDIKLNGDKATGIAAVAKNTVNPRKVDVINEGTIETVSGNQMTGVYGVGANIDNQGKVNIGTKGVAIYTTNENSLGNTVLKNNGEIILTGDSATGIVAMKVNTNQDFIGGNITGTADKLVGMYFKDSVTATFVKDVNISLGTNARGLIFDAGQDFTITSSNKNKITIGNTTDIASRGIGISALGVNGTVSNTDVIVGEGSLGLYAKDKKLTFALSTGKLESSDTNKSSILAYADENDSEIVLNGGGTLKVGAKGIALGTKSGKITADTTTVEVDGAKGLGAYVENGGSIDSNFDIKVKSAEGIGMYAKGGNVASIAKVSEITGNKSIGYVFENITNAITITNPIQLTDANATGQVGVVSKGTGVGLTVTGISVVGSGNIGIYNETTEAVTNNATLNLGDSTGDFSIGIYSEKGKVTSNGNATVGKNSVGIYGKETGTKLVGDMTIGEKGVGLYVDNTNSMQGDTEITGTLTVGANGAIGIQAKNSKTTLGGDLNVADGDSKGIFSEGNGDVETKGNITVGINSVGIYKNGTGEVKTASGKTLTVKDNGYGIFSKSAKVTNNMNVTVGTDAIGAYVDGNDLTSTGTVTVGNKGVGLLIKGTGKTLKSTGAITVGSNNSVGLYAGENANIDQNGTVTVADNNGIGVYSKGTGGVTTSGNITVGKDSIGVYKDGTGSMTIGAASQTMEVKEKGYGIYSKGANVNSHMTMTLGKEAVGIYAKGASIKQEGDITVGETTIGSSGFSDPNDNKNSIGIFGDHSNITYKGHMVVDKPLSVGIYGMNGGNIVLTSGSTLDVKNGAYGIMTGKGVAGITVENGATINVDGKATATGATEKNVSFGIAAYSGTIKNEGDIYVTNEATGIYVAGTATLYNGTTGRIHIGAGGGKAQDKPGTNAAANIGGIKVTDKGEVTIGDRVITGGKISIDGDLTMQGLGIDVSTGKTVIDARSIRGVAFVTPNFSKGTNEQKITIQDVFRTPHQGIGTFSGEIKSQSVSWIAKISDGSKSEHGAASTKDIVMVRIPYQTLIVGEKYKDLASGLEKIRQHLPEGKSSDIFKSLDNITTHGEFAQAIANVRGDVYSNIQERMKTVESIFEKSYREVLDSYNVTRDVNKFSIINSKGKHRDNTFGVAGYDYSSVGVLYLNDREGFRYGGKYGWSAGLLGSDFDFKGETSKDSKEKVLSGKLGFHYQRALDREDDNAQWKWLSRAELSLSRHRTTRNSYIGEDKYQYRARFWSGEISWKNRVFYDYDINTKWSVRPYAGIDASYGHIFKVSESGNALKLQVKGKDYFVMTPNIGVETKYIIPIKDTHQAVLKADAQYFYDATKLYTSANKAKLQDSGAGYYDLTEPEHRRSRVSVGTEIGYEKENIYGVTFRAEYQGNRKSDVNYSLRLHYKF